MKLIRTEDAVGHVLCHDLTQIIKDQYKDARFRKGHVVAPEDIPVLLGMGKEHLYVWEMTPGMLHEDEGAERLLALCANENMERSGVKEGKIELKASCDGLFLLRSESLRAVNAIDELMIATRKGGTAVKKGDKLAGMRVIPLIIAEEKLTAAKAAAGDPPLLELRPWVRKTAAIVATGYGRNNIPFATGQVTEITCHARGAYHLYPEARAIVDIGGQDSKVICLDETGGVTNFVMNDKCAAGTGRFLELMARTLELNLEEMARVGLHWEQELTISSMCTVFAESEVVSLIADNHSAADIVHGLNQSVAAKTAALASRAGAKGPYMMTGGVARNRGVTEALEARLGAPLWLPPEPDLGGALGAALFALDSIQ